MSVPTTLYRILDDTGDLLYVGISGNPGRRMAQHAEDKPWWTDSAIIVLEHFPTRTLALRAETKAVESEGPIYNKAGSAPPRYRATKYAEKWMIERLQDSFGVRRWIPRMLGVTAAPPLAPCRICGAVRQRGPGIRNRDGKCPRCFAGGKN